MRIACPSSKNARNAGSCSMRASRSSIIRTNRAPKAARERYHSRSQCVCGIRWKTRRGTGSTESAVIGERLELEREFQRLIAKDMGQPDLGIADPLYPALEQLEVGVVAEPETVQSL